LKHKYVNAEFEHKNGVSTILTAQKLYCKMMTEKSGASKPLVFFAKTLFCVFGKKSKPHYWG